MAAKQKYWAALAAPMPTTKRWYSRAPSTACDVPDQCPQSSSSPAGHSRARTGVANCGKRAEAQPVTHTLAFTYTEVISGPVAYYTLDGWVTDEPGEPVQPGCPTRSMGQPASARHPLCRRHLQHGGLVHAAVQQVLTTGAEYRASLPFQGGDDWWPTLFHTLNRLEVAEGVLERLVAIRDNTTPYARKSGYC